MFYVNGEMYDEHGGYITSLYNCKNEKLESLEDVLSKKFLLMIKM